MNIPNRRNSCNENVQYVKKKSLLKNTQKAVKVNLGLKLSVRNASILKLEERTISKIKKNVMRMHLGGAKRNREKINAKVREKYAEDPRKVLDRLRLHRKTNKETAKRYRERHKQKINAQNQLRDHVKRGNIFKPENCCICHSKEWIEGHHADYTKPLEVIWLCKKCHNAIHNRLKTT